MAALELTRVEGKAKGDGDSRTVIQIFDSSKIDAICDYLHDCELCKESVLQYVKSGDSLTIAWDDYWLREERTRLLLLKAMADICLDADVKVEYIVHFDE